MPTGSEKWPKAALGQDEVENWPKPGQTGVCRWDGSGAGRRLELGGQRTEALGPQDCKTFQRI